MAIAKKPNRQPPATTAEQAANRFIEAAAKPTARARRAPTTLRFDPELLARIDSAARRRGYPPRQSWERQTRDRCERKKSQPPGRMVLA